MPTPCSALLRQTLHPLLSGPLPTCLLRAAALFRGSGAWTATAILLLGTLTLAPPVNSAVIQVSTISDGIAVDNRCTLREAIQAANTDTASLDCPAGSGTDIIELVFDSDHDLTVEGNNEDQAQTGDLDIRWHTVIRPANPDVVVTIDAQGLDRVFEVFDAAVLTLERIQVRGGDVVGFGGCVFSQHPLSEVHLIDSEVAFCDATLFGGGIYSEGPTFLERSRVRTSQAAFGGGIYMGTTSPLTLTDSRIESNDATADGGGLNLIRLLATGSTVSNNGADRHGGGILWRPDEEKGGITSSLVNSTVAQNTSREDGGGLYVETLGSLDIANSTVAYNGCDINENDDGEGGGLFVVAGSVNLKNSIVAGNEDLTDGGSLAPDCAGTVTSQGYNLLSAIDTGDCTVSGDSTGNLVGTLALPIVHDLDCFQQSEGPTSTVALLPSSPAIDAANPAGCSDGEGTPLLVDQRGHERLWDGPDADDVARCDMGAVEFGAPPPGSIFLDSFESGSASGWSQSTLLDLPDSFALPNFGEVLAAPEGGGGCNKLWRR